MKECERKLPLTRDKTKKMRERAKQFDGMRTIRKKRKKRENEERKGKGGKTNKGEPCVRGRGKKKDFPEF